MSWRLRMRGLTSFRYLVGYLIVMTFAVSLVLTQFPWTKEVLMTYIPNLWMRFGVLAAFVFFYPIVLVVGLFILMVVSNPLQVAMLEPTFLKLGSEARSGGIARLYLAMAFGTLIILFVIMALV